MGRSIAKHSSSRKNFYIPWADEMGVDLTEPCPLEWSDFKERIRQDLMSVSDEFETPYEETWVEDEVQLLMEHGHARIVLSEYIGLACIGIVSQPIIRSNGWGHTTERPNFLSINYCDNILQPKLQSRLEERHELYRAGAYASNGNQVFRKA